MLHGALWTKTRYQQRWTHFKLTLHAQQTLMSAAGALNIVLQGKRSIDYNNTTTNLLHKWAALTKRLHRALKLKYNMFFFFKVIF